MVAGTEEPWIIGADDARGETDMTANNKTGIEGDGKPTGESSDEVARRDEILQSLTEEEWNWLRTLGEEWEVRLPGDHPRLLELATLLPGVSGMEEPPAPGWATYLRAETGFRRFWRAHCAEWRARHEKRGERAGADLSQKKRDLFLSFGWAAVDLYGVVEEAELGELAGHWRKEAGWGSQTPQAVAACAMDLLRRQEFSVYSCAYVVEGRAVSLSKYPPGEPGAAKALAETLEIRQGKPWWHPESFGAFLEWEGNRPHWPEEYQRLEEFICQKWNIDRSSDFGKEVLDEVHDAVYDVLASGREWRAAVDVLRCYFNMSTMSPSKGMRLVELLIAASNATHHDANRGFTPDEMAAAGWMGDEFDVSVSRLDLFDNPNAPIVRGHAKIGRNDPCPCGSGKKYKKCCGRNEGGRQESGVRSQE